MTKPGPKLTPGKKQSLSPTSSHQDLDFEERFNHHIQTIQDLYQSLYAEHKYGTKAWTDLVSTIRKANQNRSTVLKSKDQIKAAKGTWFLNNELAGMSLYVDRFCNTLAELPNKLDYLQELGINVLHLMPLFKSPPEASDGGYAVSDFRKVDDRFGSLQDLQSVIEQLREKDIYLMLDIALNHTSDQHDWAIQAKAGKTKYMEYYYLYKNRIIPNQFEQTLPEIFPESAPGNFTYIPECKRWVMSVFHDYQWDLNFSNPRILVEMLDHIFFYANLGVDILRIDAPAFIWKTIGTNCQNLKQAHDILQLLKAAVQIAAPGMALLGEAIVAPHEIMKYFGIGEQAANECDFAYNATLMALQWDALATGKTRVMRSAQTEIMTKPLGTSWISYTRCHDDIGLGFADQDIIKAGFEPFEHRHFLKEYYSGEFPTSKARGSLFSVNPKTNDARISGSLASLCGLESALEQGSPEAVQAAIDKILLMQAHSFFIGGLPMLYYGDEVGYLNDYTYLNDPAKSYDNRWMHRPVIDWNKNEKIHSTHSIESQLYQGTKRLLEIRKSIKAVEDLNNIEWLPDENVHLSAFVRYTRAQKLFCLFNFGPYPVYLSWYIFKSEVPQGTVLYDHWNQQQMIIGPDQEHFQIKGYGMVLAAWRGTSD